MYKRQELAYLAGKLYTRGRSELLKKAKAVASVSNIPEIDQKRALLEKIIQTDYIKTADVNEFEPVSYTHLDVYKRQGQFRTPRHIIRMMVDLMQPRADDVICDPACGTAGFLVAAGEYLRENRKQEVFFDRKNKDHYMNHMFHGFDMDLSLIHS